MDLISARRRLLAAAALLPLVPLARAGAPLVLTTGAEEPWSTGSGTGFLDRLVREAFRRAGLAALVQRFTSSERAMVNADRGIDDGVAMRIAGLERLYPSLVRVAEPIAVNDFVAFRAPGATGADGWDALAGKSVGFVNGWKIFESNVPPGAIVSRVRDADQLFTLYGHRRVEVVLHERWQGMHKMRRHGLRLVVQEPPLARVPMHMYLHRRHAALADGVSRAIVAMRVDGSYDAIWAESIGQDQRVPS